MSRVLLVPSTRELNVIKTTTNERAAELLGRSRETIRRWRREHLPDKPAKSGRPRRSVPEGLSAALGAAPDAVLARQHKVPKNTVRNLRLSAQIPAFPRPEARRRQDAA